jgi:hypothetical protein
MIMSNFLFLFIIISALCCLNSCSAENSEVLQNQSVSTPQNIKSVLSDNGKIFVKEDGWEIPGLASAKKQKTQTLKTEVQGGKKIDVNATYYWEPLVETEEPFKSIGVNLGMLRIYALREFAIGDDKFCYKVQANRVGIGSLFPFVFYDEDGDGKFETLILDEKDTLEINGRRTQIISFYTMPHIPKRFQNIE